MNMKLKNLRTQIKKLGIDGFFVSRADEFQGEYLPSSARRLADLAELLNEEYSALCTRESAGLRAVAEQLALRVVVVKVAAHHGNERAARLAQAGEVAREQLAPAAGLAREHRVGVVLRDARNLLAQCANRLTLTGRRHR